MASKKAATSRDTCSYTQVPTKIAKRGLGACRHVLGVFVDICQVSTYHVLFFNTIVAFQQCRHEPAGKTGTTAATGTTPDWGIHTWVLVPK